MYDVNRKQYILRQSSGKLLNIFYRANEGIYVRILKNSSTLDYSYNMQKSEKYLFWSSPTVLCKKSLPSFSVCMDHQDTVHILCQDTVNIKYLLYMTDGTIKTIYEAPTYSLTYHSSSIYCINNSIWIFYIVEENGTHALFYQNLAQEGFMEPPQFIDFAAPGRTPYRVVKDTTDHFYLVYINVEESELYQIGFRELNSDTATTGNFEPLSSSHLNMELLSAVIDRNNTFHFCYSTKSLEINNTDYNFATPCMNPMKGAQKSSCNLLQTTESLEYELIYAIKRKDSLSIEGYRKLSSFPNYIPNSSLLLIKDKIILYWLKGNHVFFCLSLDNGSTWSNIENYSFLPGTSISCILYISNVYDELESVFFYELPGVVSNSFHLAFLNEFYLKQSNSIMEDVNGKIEHLARHLSQESPALQHWMGEMNAKIEKLEQKQKILEAQLLLYESNYLQRHSLMEEIKVPRTRSQSNLPLMKGSGFKEITPKYLESMGKKQASPPKK